MGGNFVFGLLLLSVALVGAQEYVVWDEPETDIWEEYSQPIAKPNEQLLELCKNYHLTINNKLIDCSDIEFEAKQDDLHVIHKREVEDVELEGSGNGESGKPEISLYGEHNENGQVEAGVEIPVAANASDSQNLESEVVAKNPANLDSDKVPEADTAEVPAAKVEDAAPDSVPETAVEPSELDNAQEESAVDSSVAANVPIESVVVGPSESDNAQGESVANPSEAESLPAVVEESLPAVVESSDTKDESAIDPPAAESDSTLEESPVNPPAEKTAAVEPSVAENVPEASVPAAEASDNVQEESAVNPPAEESVLEKSAPNAELDNAQEIEAIDPPVVPKESAIAESDNAQVESAVDPPAEESVQAANAELDNAQEVVAVDPPLAESVPEVPAAAEPSDNAQGESAAAESDPEESAVVEPSVAEAANALEESPVNPPAVETAPEAADVNAVAESDNPSVAESDKAQEESALVEPGHNQDESIVKPSEAEKAQVEPENVPEESVVIEPVELEKQPESDATGQIFDTAAKETKVVPSDLAEVDIALKQPEIVDEKQSGNAILFKEPKLAGASSAVEGSDSEKHLASLATNEDLKNQSVESEQPSTGESAKTVSKASKDTTILIVLFVVVLVIGGAAFTHHMIKMRKAKRAETSSVVDGIRKSLQSLAGNGKAPTPDVEQGTEMKPLMNLNNSSSPVMVKEYSDKKKDEA